MSQGNLEVVQRIWSLYSERTVEAVNATFDENLVAADSMYFPAKEMPSASSYVGREGFFKFIRGWAAEFSDWEVRVEEFIDAGDDHVVVLLKQHALGRASGAQVETRFAAFYKLNGGRVVERRDYNDPAEALEAAGLSD